MQIRGKNIQDKEIISCQNLTVKKILCQNIESEEIRCPNI